MDDLQLVLPSEVRTIFRLRRCSGDVSQGVPQFYEKTINLATAAPEGIEAQPGTGGTQVIRSTALGLFDVGTATLTNQDALDALALRIAEDHYGWLARQFHLVHTGVAVPGPLSAQIDLIEMAYGDGDVTTTFESAGWTGAAEELQQHDPANADCTDTDGVIVGKQPGVEIYGPLGRHQGSYAEDETGHLVFTPSPGFSLPRIIVTLEDGRLTARYSTTDHIDCDCVSCIHCVFPFFGVNNCDPPSVVVNESGQVTGIPGGTALGTVTGPGLSTIDNIYGTFSIYQDGALVKSSDIIIDASIISSEGSCSLDIDTEYTWKAKGIYTYAVLLCPPSSTPGTYDTIKKAFVPLFDCTYQTDSFIVQCGDDLAILRILYPEWILVSVGACAYGGPRCGYTPEDVGRLFACGLHPDGSYSGTVVHPDITVEFSGKDGSVSDFQTIKADSTTGIQTIGWFSNDTPGSHGIVLTFNSGMKLKTPGFDPEADYLCQDSLLPIKLKISCKPRYDDTVIVIVKHDDFLRYAGTLGWQAALETPDGTLLRSLGVGTLANWDSCSVNATLNPSADYVCTGQFAGSDDSQCCLAPLKRTLQLTDSVFGSTTAHYVEPVPSPLGAISLGSWVGTLDADGALLPPMLGLCDQPSSVTLKYILTLGYAHLSIPVTGPPYNVVVPARLDITVSCTNYYCLVGGTCVQSGTCVGACSISFDGADCASSGSGDCLYLPTATPPITFACPPAFVAIFAPVGTIRLRWTDGWGCTNQHDYDYDIYNGAPALVTYTE